MIVRPHQQAAMCAGKETFDRATASRVAREHNASRRGTGNRQKKTPKDAVSAFECRCCGKWHVGKERN